MVVRLINRRVLRVAGPDVFQFLQGLVTSDVKRLSNEVAIPAAFLSPKGRVLCDVIIQKTGEDECLLDVHKEPSASLLRMLRRHRLRLPLEIDDISDDKNVFAIPGPSDPVEGFFQDPRYSGLGLRGMLASREAVEDDSYERQRILCGVPEGPVDIPIDQHFPLHCNLDLMSTVSFNKGCYVGQELTTRTKMRGVVRKRYVGIVVTDGDVDDGKYPLPMSVLDPTNNLSEMMDEEIFAHIGEKWKSVGKLSSVYGNVGLCQMKLPSAANDAESFIAACRNLAPLFIGGVQLKVKIPPYAFA